MPKPTESTNVAPPDLGDAVELPRTRPAFSAPVFMPSLRPPGSASCGPVYEGDDGAVEPSPRDWADHGALAAPNHVWRKLDRARGHLVQHYLPDDLLHNLQAAAASSIDPRTINESGSGEPFAGAEALIDFVLEHVARANKPGAENRRNKRYLAFSRREYSFRLPRPLRDFYAAVRTTATNPYTSSPFASASQAICFCLHAFLMAEPWRSIAASELWRDLKTNDHRSLEGSNHDEGMLGVAPVATCQMQVRIDESQFIRLRDAVAKLERHVARASSHRLTMASLWLSAAIWGTHNIDWSSIPARVKPGGGAGASIDLGNRDEAPPGLLSI